jgi:hypothetical protein
MSATYTTDYLIIGSGAVGMAFADTLLSETDATIIIIDKFAKPGGHWNVAYPFVTLHQPSAFYGVSSAELSNGLRDEIGLNKGLHDLASGAEVMAYYDKVMKHTFLPSGRVQYFPMCEYLGHGKFKSTLTGEIQQVNVKLKTVDCSYLKTTVPSTHTPNFNIADGVQFIPINDLTKINHSPDGYIVIGGGKTGIDACLWLLENNIDPDAISWIVSRDAWLIDRENTQPSIDFFESTMNAQAAQFEAINKAQSVPHLFECLEEAGVLVRIDTTITPSMFHGATVSQLELQELRKIKNVIRKGRVIKIEKDKILLEKGVIATSQKKVHVDCSASAISNLTMKPIFEEKLITPQTVRSYQPVFSAAFIAHIEARYDNDKKKNQLCQVVPLPNHDTDWLRMMAVFMLNQYNWNQDKELRQWLKKNRLDGFSQMVSSVSKEDVPKQEILMRLRNNAMPAAMKLQQLIAEIDQASLKDDN